MSNMGEMFNDLKKMRQEKRADNRENSAKCLTQREIPFVPKNCGAHLIVEGGKGFIDFWPGTEKWHSRWMATCWTKKRSENMRSNAGNERTAD